MANKTVASLRGLAGLENALEDIPGVLKRLLVCTAESKHLEWKSGPPVGPSVTLQQKYRMVKAVISFANWEGGFVVFGVEPSGEWIGLAEADMRQVDPAMITELVNGCIFPEIPSLNFAALKHRGGTFAVLHVPPSESMPHITTKEIVEQEPGRRSRVILAKHALYCRQGAKSDLATPQQHYKIITKKTEFLRNEMVRRIKEVPVPVLSSGSPSRRGVGSTLTIARVTKDPNAPAIRLTRTSEGTAGVFLHEELSEGLFDEINNVLDTNALLARGRPQFVFGEPIYYRIYAERHHVDTQPDRIQVLARTALHDIYGPTLFWFLLMPPNVCAKAIVDAAADVKSPHARSLIRIVTLLGPTFSDWLYDRFHAKWGRHPQPPDYFYAFKGVRAAKALSDRRLLALKVSSTKAFLLPDSGTECRIDTLLDSPQMAASHLSRVCLKVFDGDKALRGVSRSLDIVAYGKELQGRAGDIEAVFAQQLG
jgi:hypothetical protein